MSGRTFKFDKSPCGQYLACGKTGLICLISTKTWDVYKRIALGFQPLSTVKFSSDGQYLAIHHFSSQLENTAVILSTMTWKVVQRIELRGVGISSSNFSPDGKYLAVGDGTGKICVREVLTSDVLLNVSQTIKMKRNVNTVIFSPDGQYLVGGDEMGEICVISVSTWEVVQTIEIGGCMNAVFSSDGQYLVCGTGKGEKVCVLLTTTWEVGQTIHVEGYVHSVAFSPDGKFLACALKIYNPAQVDVISTLTWEIVKTIDIGIFLPVVLFSTDGQYLFTGDKGDQSRGEYRVISTTTWQMVQMIDISQYKMAVHKPSPGISPSWIETSSPVGVSDGNVVWQAYCEKTEVSPTVEEDLFKVISSFKIVLLCDDSGSMTTRIEPPGTSESSDAPVKTRWGELMGDVVNCVQLTCAAQAQIGREDGLDIHFMNRLGRNSVKNIRDIPDCFQKGPTGATPMITSLQKLFNLYQDVNSNVLIVVITDGEPTDGDYLKLLHTLKRKSDKFYISMVMCSDDKEEMGYLSGWDTKLARFYNAQDYGEELRFVKNCNEADFKFTRANYIQMIMLGPVFPTKYQTKDFYYNNDYTKSSYVPAITECEPGTEQVWAKPSPENLCAMIRKEGHFIKNWKWRYFVLQKGSLAYYSSPPGIRGSGKENDRKMKGQLDSLRSHSVQRRGERCLWLLSTKGYRLNLEFAESSDRETWFRGIQSHIAYAEEMELPFRNKGQSNNNDCTIT